MKAVSAILDLREQEVLKEFKAVLNVIAHRMAIPLFLLFWFADLIYIPEQKWIFLALRMGIIPICILTTTAINRAKSVKNAEMVAAFYAIALAAVINVMIAFISDPGTLYYSGLNLVAIGCLSFLPFSPSFYFLTALGIYLPYYIIVLNGASDLHDYSAVGINSFFVIGTLTICFIIRFFHEKSRSSEINARHDLKKEIESRDKIIRTKTEEGIRLKTLSSQFSPQIVESINNGKLSLESGSSRAQICVIFIDIVGSTERVTQLDKDKIEKVIGKFLDDAIKILLLYDLTIDKFMGDGIIAFCNAPQKRPDFISRVVMAALDVRHKIEQDRGFYEKYWGQSLGIRIGIAHGFVNVGFYGSQKHFRNYTAIGPALALAARLCSSATTNQILVDLDIYEKIAYEFDAVFVDKKELKGFNLGLIHTYEIRGVLSSANGAKFLATECPNCLISMSLEENKNGQLALYCKSCQKFYADKEDSKST